MPILDMFKKARYTSIHLDPAAAAQDSLVILGHHQVLRGQGVVLLGPEPLRRQGPVLRAPVPVLRRYGVILQIPQNSPAPSASVLWPAQKKPAR